MKKFIEKKVNIILTVILVLMFVLEITSACQESQTMDEAVHLSAGYSYLRTGDFRMNPEHPPLLKYLSALPLLFLDLHQPAHYKSWAEADKWQFAKDFLYHNKVPAEIILLLGRMPVMLLSLLAAYFVFKWAKELFGIYAGLFSVLFFAFSPNILAHSRYVTTDLPVTLVILVCIYYFGKYLENPKCKNLVIASIIFGIAQVTKFSSIILLPILVILYLIKWWQNRTHVHLFSFKNFLKTFIIILLITFAIIIITYGFEIKKPLDDPDVAYLYHRKETILKNKLYEGRSGLDLKILELTDLDKKSGQIIYQAAKNIPLPAYSYVRGIIQLAGHDYFGHDSYLLGQYSKKGFLYYFPVAFFVKSTPSELIIFIFLLIFFIKDLFSSTKGRGIINYLETRPFYYYLLILPPIIYFLWSLTSHLNLGVRHILPIYPFIFILSGYMIKVSIKRLNNIFKIILVTILLLHITSSILIYPHFLAYFNKLVGGPQNGAKYLVDSNLDWGQDLKNLEKYLKKNQIQSLCLSYFGSANISYYLKMDTGKIKDVPQADSPTPDCSIAISISDLIYKKDKYGWLLNYKPIIKIGYSIYIFNLKNQ